MRAEHLTEVQTNPVEADVPACWPPVAHIHDRATGPLKEGKLALCGAKLMGIPLPDAHEVCGKCREIAMKISNGGDKGGTS